MKRFSHCLALMLSLLLSMGVLTACESDTSQSNANATVAAEEAAVALPETSEEAFSSAEVPAYDGAAYVVVHDNVPYFTQEDLTTDAFEQYARLDGYGRAGVAFACVGQELMPTEERGSIGQVKPSGWHTVKYDCVDGKYLYNRCHLIGYQLTGENANEDNLITGTRYLNMEGMLPFENMVADYVKETGNHVLYRVTPIFEGTNLVAGGVLMEGYSVEDGGEGICYCVYAYNVQPGITIDYASGDSWEAISEDANAASQGAATNQTTPAENTGGVRQTASYGLNNNTMTFHVPGCRSIKQMKNPLSVTATRDELLAQGYSPCGICKP